MRGSHKSGRSGRLHIVRSIGLPVVGACKPLRCKSQTGVRSADQIPVGRTFGWEGNSVTVFHTLLGMLAAAVVLLALSRRMKVPYPVLLALAGAALAIA